MGCSYPCDWLFNVCVLVRLRFTTAVIYYLLVATEMRRRLECF